MNPQQPSDPNANPVNTPAPTPAFTPAPTTPDPAPQQTNIASPVQVSQAQGPQINPTPDPLGTSNDWPGAFGIYKASKAAVRLNLVPLVLMFLITLAVSILTDVLFKGDYQIIGDIISFIVSSLISVATIIALVAGVRSEKVGLGDTLKRSVPYWLPMIGISILTAVIFTVSLVLLIVPFFFVLPRLALATYYLVDKKLGIIESLKASWDETKGHALKFYGIIGANLAMFLLVFTLIGIPFAIYFLIMYSAATAVLYEYVRKQRTPTPTPVN